MFASRASHPYSLLLTIYAKQENVFTQVVLAE